MLEDVRGRQKTLVYIGEGIDCDISGTQSGLIENVRELIAAAGRSNVTIHTVDPLGLRSLAEDGLDPSTSIDTLGNLVGLEREMKAALEARDQLVTVAEETGGMSVVNTNDLAAGFDRIVRRAGTYYVLGYYPTNEKHDGSLRRLRVSVTRPGLEVRTRTSYRAPRQPAAGTAPARASRHPLATGRPDDSVASALLRQAEQTPLPVAGLHLSVATAAFRGPAGGPAVWIAANLCGADVHLAEKDGRFAGRVEFSAIAHDATGRVAASDRKSAALALRPDTEAHFKELGLRYVTRLDLPPGRYRLRVTAADGSVAGSVHTDVVVPDLGAAPLAVSGVLLTSRRAASAIAAGESRGPENLLPGLPAPDREFGTSDDIAAGVEVYTPGGGPMTGVRASAVILAEDGREVTTTEREAGDAQSAWSGGRWPFVLRIPAGALVPGMYRARFEVSGPAVSGTSSSTIREVVFRIAERTP